MAGDLDKKAGEFVSERKSGGGGGGGTGAASAFGAAEQLLTELAKGNGKINDPSIRQRLMELKQRTSVDDYARKFAELVPYVADASRGELAHLFHRGLKPEVVKHLVSRINIEEDTWTAIRDKASDLDEVLFQQNRGSKTMASFPKGRTGEAKKPGADPMDWSIVRSERDR